MHHTCGSPQYRRALKQRAVNHAHAHANAHAHAHAHTHTQRTEYRHRIKFVACTDSAYVHREGCGRLVRFQWFCPGFF